MTDAAPQLPAPSYATLRPALADLIGPRLTIREYRLDDATALNDAVAASRDHLRPWLPFADAHQTLDETRDYIIQSQVKDLLRQSFSRGIWLNETGAFLGGIGAIGHDWSIGYFEIGYWLRRDMEGHGYMTEAVRLLTDALFATYDAQRVEIRCDARNTHSAGVPRRLGFVEEGCLRNLEPDSASGGLRSILYFALLSSDPRWPSPPPPSA